MPPWVSCRSPMKSAASTMCALRRAQDEADETCSTAPRSKARMLHLEGEAGVLDGAPHRIARERPVDADIAALEIDLDLGRGIEPLDGLRHGGDAAAAIHAADAIGLGHPRASAAQRSLTIVLTGTSTKPLLSSLSSQSVSSASVPSWGWPMAMALPWRRAVASSTARRSPTAVASLSLSRKTSREALGTPRRCATSAATVLAMVRESMNKRPRALSSAMIAVIAGASLVKRLPMWLLMPT